MSPRTRNKKTAAAAKNVTPPADAKPDDGLDALSDEELAAKVAERYPEYDPAMIPIAIAEKRDEVIADLRKEPGDVTEDTTADDGLGEQGDRHPIAEAPVADTEAEFPTDWHRDAYIAGLEREVEGAKLRVEELTEMGNVISADALAEANDRVDNAKKELARVKRAK